MSTKQRKRQTKQEKKAKITEREQWAQSAEEEKYVPQTGVDFRQEKEMHPAEEKYTVSAEQPKNRDEAGRPDSFKFLSVFFSS